jgi:anti-anti-sigma factor
MHESQAGDCVRLVLSGELDTRSAHRLEDRLARLRALNSPVRLNLSRLDFIDSTALHLLVRTVGDARIKGWEFRIERDVSPQVLRVFRLVQLDTFVIGDGAR